MGEKKETLNRRLEDAIEMVDKGIQEVIDALNFEKDNLEELIPAGDQESHKHLSQLRGLVKGLQSRLADLREQLISAHTAGGELQDPTEEIEASDQSDLDEDVSIKAREAEEIRHDDSVTFGDILRSLLMANEPAQRERARGDDES